MSVTTSTNTVSGAVLQVLTDYDLHHSGSPEVPGQAPPPNPSEAPQASNPPSWPTDYREVPPYRPINRNLDMEQRPGGLNPVEYAFIFTMLNGVGINAAMNSIWRKTGGRINDRIFKYKIGGET